jgi:hypothetical protein
MRYDAGTHAARAELFAETASHARSRRERTTMLAHAVIATQLAELAEGRGAVFVFVNPKAERAGDPGFWGTAWH